MSVSNNGKTAKPRQRRTQLKNVTNNQDQSINTRNGGQVTKMTDTQPKETSTQLAPLPGNRPIASSNLVVHETMSVSGVRPIAPSDLQVVSSVNIMGIRPIAANTIKVVDSINLSGVRPIASSALVVSETYSVMGNRPVASNEIDDSYALMGFLD